MKIECSVIWDNCDGSGTTWFFPRYCRLGDGSCFMTVQGIEESDYYTPVCESYFDGEKWSYPQVLDGFGWRLCRENIYEAFGDFVPYYHAPTDTVLMTAINFYYKDGMLYDTLGDFCDTRVPDLKRYSAWSARNNKGEWSTILEKIKIPGMDGSIYSCGCSQWVFKGDHDVYIPFSYGFIDRRDRMVCVCRFYYDGKELRFIEKGNTLEFPCNRGLLEPSVIEFGGGFLMTVRTEDGKAYHSRSEDGLHWESLEAWTFDDGNILETESTQQHFLVCGQRIFLVYTRKTDYNTGMLRFRAPLFIAELNEKLEMIRDSEQIIFEYEDNGEGKSPGFGNFHIVTLDERQAIIGCTEERGYDSFRGKTLLARITL